MKVYKSMMNGLAWIEKLILAVVTVVVTVTTFANVVSRYVFHASFSWSEELVINLFIALIMMGCALCARDGSLISLSLVFDRLNVAGKKLFVAIISVVNLVFYVVLAKVGFDKVFTEIANGKETFSLRWPQWWFTILLPIGCVFLIIHTFEFFIDVMRGEADCVKLKKKDASATAEGGND